MAQTDPILKASPTEAGNPKRRLLDCYQRGMHLATCEKNYDYAHAMFAECVMHDPGNLQFVEAMMQNFRARTPKRKKSLFKSRRGGGHALKKAVQHKQWRDVVQKAIELLGANPWDVETLRALAEACAAMHHNEVELVYLKQALDAEPKNIDVNRHCARSLGRMGQFDQAIACWHRVEKLAVKDREATRMITMLAEEKLKYPDGRPPAAQLKQVPVEVEELKPQAPIGEVVLGPEQKLEQSILQNPQNIDNYLEIAELLLRSARFNAAEMVLRRAITACGEQQALVDQLNRVHFLRAEEQRRLNKQRAIEQQLAEAPIRIPWMELAIGSAMLLLVLQLAAPARALAWKIIDMSQWSRFGWFMFNIMVLVVLFFFRYGPDFQTVIRRRRIRRYRASKGLR